MAHADQPLTFRSVRLAPAGFATLPGRSRWRKPCFRPHRPASSPA
jgi:hypothetical protein